MPRNPYSYKNGNYTQLDEEPLSGVVPGIGTPADWNAISRYKSPLLAAIINGTGYADLINLEGITIRFGHGSVSAPSITFIQDTTTGLYRVGAGNVGFASGGVLIFDYNGTRILAAVPIYLPNGTIGAPGLSWGAETDSGLYRAGAQDFRMSVNSTQIFDWTKTAINLRKAVSVLGVDFNVKNGSNNAFFLVDQANKQLNINDDDGTNYFQVDQTADTATWNGPLGVVYGVNSYLRYNGVNEPSLGADQNNYALDGSSVRGVHHRFTSSTAINITGFANGSNGRVIYATNVGSNNITLKNESGSSTAANRITTGTGNDAMLPPGGALILIYDSTSSRWRVIHGLSYQTLIHLVSSAAPASPAEGDVWLDSTQKTVTVYEDGIKQSLEGVIYTATATGTVSNTATETTVVGGGVGSLTLPANFLVAGKTVRVTASGVYSTQAVPVTLNMRVKLGTTNICVTGDQTPAGSMSNRFWRIFCDITCRSTGAGGTVFGQAAFEHMATAGATGSPTWWEMSNTGTTAIDTTVSQAVDVTADWGAGVAAADSISCTNLSVEVLN